MALLRCYFQSTITRNECIGWKEMYSFRTLLLLANGTCVFLFRTSLLYHKYVCRTCIKKNHGAGSLHMNRYRGVLHNRAKTSVNIMMSRSCVTLSDLVTSVSFPPTHPLHLEFFPEPGEIDDAVKKIANIMFICVPRNCDDVRHNIVCKLN